VRHVHWPSMADDALPLLAQAQQNNEHQTGQREQK
jgi:hypothetical protein